jgi:hypothetical protein
VEGRNLAIGLLVCGGLILIAIVALSWVTAPGGRGSAGPRGVEECRGGRCESASWSEIDPGGRLPGDISVFAMLSLVTGIGAAGMSIASGATVLSRNLAKTPIKPARIVIGMAAGFAAYWEVRVLTTDELGDVGPGWSAFVGIGAMIAAGVLIQKLAAIVAYARPMVAPMGPYAGQPHAGQPHPGQPHAGQPQQPMPQQAQPMPQQARPMPQQAAAPSYPCPRCQRSLVFVAQYQRWFCEACRQYA